MLEDTASSPYADLEPTRPDVKYTPEERLRRAFSWMLLIVMYTSHRQSVAWLAEFETAPAEPKTDITRSRNVVTRLLRAIVRDMIAIPSDSPLRTKHQEAFEISHRLSRLHDKYLAGNEEAPLVPEWTAFWNSAMPMIAALGSSLEQAGYGIGKDI